MMGSAPAPHTHGHSRNIRRLADRVRGCSPKTAAVLPHSCLVNARAHAFHKPTALLPLARVPKGDRSAAAAGQHPLPLTPSCRFPWPQEWGTGEWGPSPHCTLRAVLGEAVGAQPAPGVSQGEKEAKAVPAVVVSLQNRDLWACWMIR